jgi:proteasome accessory factor A
MHFVQRCVNSLFGIETEYGITVEGADATHLVAESREVVKAYRGRFAAPWNYRTENPRADVRGFQVDKLSQDPNDAQFDRPGTAPTSPIEDRCDRVLVNGARLYNDHGHPEYSTPECADLRSLVAHDKVGERIVLECARQRSADSGRTIDIFKNNTDFHGASYGTHESYLLHRGMAWEHVVHNLAPFLATRIIYAGAGKVGTEERAAKCQYQLSQRADFFQVLQSVDTLSNRPLVNTRDEPHGDASRFRRLHVIAGDANMSEYATALRVGTTNLVAALIESGWQTPVVLRDPVKAIKQISRDESYRWLIETTDGDQLSAIDVQRAYWRAVAELDLPGSHWIVGEWKDTLDALETDPFSLADRLDWVAKKSLLDQFVEAEGLDWTEDIHTLQSLDLTYHNVDPEISLYYGLVEAGAMETLVSEEEIEEARCHAPQNTRAALRSVLVRKFSDKIKSTSWGGFIVEENGAPLALTLPETHTDYASLAAQIEGAQSLTEIAALLRES